MTSIHAPTASLVRLASVVALIGLAIALVAAPVAAQPYPPDPEITITTPGATIIVEGRSWKPGVQVTIIFNNPSGQTFSATAIADENGEIETDVPIPDDTESGTLAVAFKGTGADGSPREEQGTVQVVSPDDANAPDGARSAGVVGSSDSAGGSSGGAGGSSGTAGTAGSSDGGDSSGAATASEQLALGQTDLGRTSATVPTTSSQSPVILLAIALMGAGVASLFGARRVRARRAAQ